jgi:hypothetical protein
VTLAERLLAIHAALDAAGIPHSFGGAIALAYWTSDPRGTSDIDVNIFAPAERASPALDALPAGIQRKADTVERIARDGQVRLFWDDTPVDLFFDNVPLHVAAARNSQTVPFAGESIPVLGPVELAAFKAMFDRTRDWADIESMLEAETLDVAALRKTLRGLVAESDERFRRIEDAVQRADRARSQRS